MKVVVQRVAWAKVSVDGRVVGQCGPGLLVLAAAGKGDTLADADKMADRIAGLRIFNDKEGKMNLALADLPPSNQSRVLAISNFTLYGDVYASRRPSFMGAAGFDEGRVLFDQFVSSLESRVEGVETGEFGADMKVELMNDGPVTLAFESK